MSKKKTEEAPAPGAPAYMSTYGDLMTLLLCFFVLLFSMSTVDVQKFEMIVQSFAQKFSIFEGGSSSIGEEKLVSNGMQQLTELDNYEKSMGKAEDAENNIGANREEIEKMMNEIEAEKLKESEKLADEIQHALNQANIQNEVDVSFNSQYVMLELNGALLFDSGSDELKEEGIPILIQIGKILLRYSNSIVEIEGHTDNVPISGARFKNNSELSSFRALSVFDLFVSETSILPSALNHSGRGEYVPIADNTTAEGRARNRRVEIKVHHELSAY